MAFAALLDLLRQVSGILQPAHGGTGSTHGEARVVRHALNSTGGSLPLYAVVEYTFGANDGRIRKVAAANEPNVLGVLVGYYNGLGELVEAACPDLTEAAVLTIGVTPVLIGAAVTRGEFAFSHATDGTAQSSATAAAGAFGLFLSSADTSAGHTTAIVSVGLTGSAGGGGMTFGTPALTLSTSNSGGASSNAIRTDATVAVFDATVPVTQAMGDSAATGSAGVAARRDHKHGMPALGTTAQAIGTSAGGSATTPSKSDHVHATGAGTPSTQAMGDSASTGTGPAAAMTDHKHAMPAFATPAIAHGTSANAGTATTPIRSDATLATFDTTAPVTQDFSDAAATGSADRAARRDHKHGMPALGTGASDAAAGNHTHGAAGGGTWDGVVIKAADEDVSSNTTVQDDDELFSATLVSGGFYQFEAHIFISSPVGLTGPDFKYSWGEDNNFRGYMASLRGNSGTGVSEWITGSIQQNQTQIAQTAGSVFGILIIGNWVSGGGVFRLKWAQGTSSGNLTRCHAGSTLKYKRLN